MLECEHLEKLLNQENNMFKISVSIRKKAIPLILLMVVIALSSAFYIVWVQQQISRTAQSSKLLEADLAESSRKLRYTDERIARSHHPVVLQSKVTCNLRPLVKKQVVFVREREHAAGRSYAISQSYEVSTGLAKKF